MEALGKGFLWTFEAKDKAFEVGVAIGHQFYCLLLGLVVETLLYTHP